MVIVPRRGRSSKPLRRSRANCCRHLAVDKPGADRPLPAPTPSKSMSTASPTARTSSSPASWSISRRPACIPAIPPAPCRPIRCGRDHGANSNAQTVALARALNVARADERAVRHQGRRHLRARGQSARQPHRAVRRQGDRRADRQDRRAHHGGRDAGQRSICDDRRASQPCRGQGSGVPVRPLPRRRHRAGPGDEIHRRGHGHGPRASAAPSPRASSAPALAAAGRHGLHVGERRRQGWRSSRRAR